MSRLRWVVAGLMMTLSATAAVGAAAADETVIIRERLRPAQIEIDAGTTITWRNRDDERHRVRSKDGPVRFDSKNLEPGESFSFTFTMPGEYPYYDHRNRDDADYFGSIVVLDAGADAAVATDSAQVTVVDDAFGTARVTLTPGGSVTWVNRGADEHTVSANDLSFDSGSMPPGATFSMTFAEPGEYPYFCQIHPEMRATVEVVDDAVVATADDPTIASDPDLEPEQPDPAAQTDTADAPSIGSALDLLATPAPDEAP